MLLHLILLSFGFSTVCGQLTAVDCSSYMRRPEYTDIDVDCGTDYMGLAIQLCPVVYTGYNESLLFINNIMDDPACKGTVDTSVAPPVLRFRFPINEASGCGSKFKTISTPGTGIFSEFSNVETVNISGVVRSYDPTKGVVTFNAELKYFYSCAYPLEYLINNTQLDVSATSIAMKDGNGSFISTLSLRLFSDANFTRPLIIPRIGIQLRTHVFVQVHASNLTSQYFVLLDRCFASPAVNPENSTYHNLFVPCFADEMIRIFENGVSDQARFSFPAFRFLEQQNQTVSRYYLHCITRLCEMMTCVTYRMCLNGRRRRDLGYDSSLNNGLSESATITSPVIVTRVDTETAPTPSNTQGSSGTKTSSASSAALGVGVGIVLILSILIIGIAAVYAKRLLHSTASRLFYG